MLLKIKHCDVASFLGSLNQAQRSLVDQIARRDGQFLLIQGTAEQIASVVGPMQIGPPARRPASPTRVSTRTEACRHRGEQVQEVDCDTCAGKVRLKVFSCSQHGKCSLSTKPIEGAKSCQGCQDYAPLAEPVDPGRQA